MNSISVALVVLVTFVVFAAGTDLTQSTKVLSPLRLTKDGESDLLLIGYFFIDCTDAAPLLQNCLEENNYVPDPANEEEICATGTIRLNCQYSAIVATTCTGKEEAMDAVRRMQLIYESVCSSLGNAATSNSVVARFIFVITLCSLASVVI